MASATRLKPAMLAPRRVAPGAPYDVLWRRKEQFGQGTGMNTVLSEHFEATVTGDDFERERYVVDPPLRTREELAYYRLFADRLRGVRPKGTIGRFVEA